MNATSFGFPVAKHRHAVCTLVMKNYRYGVGAAVMAHSVIEHNVEADLVCIVTTDFIRCADIPEDLRYSRNLHVEVAEGGGRSPCLPADIHQAYQPRAMQESRPSDRGKNLSAFKILLRVFAHVVLIDPISYPVKENRHYGHWLDQCFSKLYVFRLTMYEKVLFLDADMICLGDFSPIFSLPCPFGTLVPPESESGPSPGYPSGYVITKHELENSLVDGNGISGACFCVAPSKAEFDRAVTRIVSRRRQTNGPYFETLNSLFPANYHQEYSLKAGPDEQLLGWMFFEHGVVGTAHGTLSGWINLSRQFNCPAWLKHKFERGDHAIANLHKGIDVCGEKDRRDRGLHNKGRKVYIIHFVTRKPWNAVKNGRCDRIWPDMWVWFEYLASLRNALVTESGDDNNSRVGEAALDGDIKAILELLPKHARFMSQEQADEEYTKNRRNRRKNQLGDGTVDGISPLYK